ncbi:hypothetical protein M9H77_35648 [Catharanthus roseus]|uniref:Uncharacterized protein n=1 Tax=Catharanthus roseus TaxID=4058 RepID=A0ACB9ZRG9_CATRO|nr:hypothetical protein M9H77_35648 [Catharanthus roseus]
MSLSLPIAVLVGVRAGRMLDQLHLHDMEEKISNLALEVLKEKIFNHLEILYQVYLETPQNIPTGVNFQAKAPFPSSEMIEMARIQAEDLFEVKVEIIKLMAGLDPREIGWDGELEPSKIPVPPRENTPSRNFMRN